MSAHVIEAATFIFMCIGFAVMTHRNNRHDR